MKGISFEETNELFHSLNADFLFSRILLLDHSA